LSLIKLSKGPFDLSTTVCLPPFTFFSLSDWLLTLSDVIHDESNFKSNELQQLFYHQCYTFGRSSTSVSLRNYPPSSLVAHFNRSDPAVYYAHLAGNRAKVLDESLDVDDGGISTVSGGTATSQSVVPLKQMHQKFTGGQHSMWFM
jgi:hypothetical protein